MAECVVSTRTKRTKNEIISSIKAFERTASKRSVNVFTVKERLNSGHEAFRAIARIKRECEKKRAAPRYAKTLMDPGAELNLIQKALLDIVGKEHKLKVHAREACEITLMNNNKEIGRISEAVYMTFTLTGVTGAEHAFHEWMYVWEGMSEEMILGSQFCKENEFTSFHTRLSPWTEILSHNRKKRSLESVTCVEEEDESTAVLRDDEDDEQLLPSPLERTRDRVETTCEKVYKHANKFAKAKRAETAKTAGRRVAANRVFASISAPNSHANHTPVDYDKYQSKYIAQHLARHVIDDQKILLKKLTQLKEADVNLTMEEQETMRDTARMCAREAAKIYEKNHRWLEKNETKEANSSYFMSDDEDGEAGDHSERKFANGQCIVLQNLVNFSELNNKPARIVTYDERIHKYVVSLASPRGYWYASEDKLKSIDPLPQKDDFQACGIDHSTGQPTLDPLAKPVHRQYGKYVSEALSQRIAILLEKYKDVFGKDISRACKFKPMKIELVPNANLPRNPRHWKNSPAQRAEVRTQLQSLIEMNVVKESTTAIVSNVLLVKRPGMPGKFRFTIDFRQLNDATVAQPWQMPDVESQLSRLSGKSIFGCIDLSSYYHQIELDKGSRYLTGFVTEDGVFEYQRVPMGLKNACAHAQSVLQEAIDKDPVLSKYGIRNYFDDLPLAAETEDDFIEQLEAILKLGVNLGLKFNAEKSIFGVDSITHVGFVVRKEGIEVDPQRIDSLREVQQPKSMKGVQSVLGVWNYIRNFIPNFSTRALPLTNMVGKSASKTKTKAFIWTDECQKAFDDLKAATLDTSLLANIDYTKTIFIRSDSSQFGAGAVLFQFNEQGQECPIAYASRKYTIAERNYCTFQQEAAAVVWALEKFAPFHQGHHVVVQSDHKNLSWISKSAMPQLTRWRLRLQDFDFSLEYYEGVKNVVADGLSRLRVDDKDIDISIRDFLPEHAAQQSYLQGSVPVRCLNEYSAVSYRKGSLTAAEQSWAGGTAPSDEPPPKEGGETTLWDDVTHEEDDEINCEAAAGAEYRNFAPIAAVVDAPPAIPHIDATIPEDIFHKAHNSVVGHNGVLVTLNRVLRMNKEWASRKEMLEQIDQFIAGCPECQKFRKRHNRRTDERFVIQGNPFSELSVDILKLPKRDCHNNLYVVVVVDSFSRWVSLEATETKCALDAARAILRTVGNFGVPLTIRSDGGKEFVNDVLASIELILGIKHHKMMAYHHEANSLAEKANRSVLENLRNIIFDNRYIFNGEHRWSDLLPLVQRIMNASFNSSIGCSPASLVFGNNIDLDRCLITPQPEPVDGVDPTNYVEVLSHNQRVVMDAAAVTLHATHEKNLKKWNRNHKKDSEVKKALLSMTGDEELPVWVLAKVEHDAPLAKWKPRWAGPFRLLDFKDASTSVVRLFDTVSHKVVEAHINDVALWDARFESSEEGLKRIAEADNWSYPIDAIMGIALEPESEEEEPVALPLDAARLVKNKHKYLFSVKWQGYAEPSWEPFSTVVHTSVFELFANAHPNLKLRK